eukprot:3448034-Pyramimonas_sp.AAC.1
MTNTLKFYYVEHTISDEYTTEYKLHQSWCSSDAEPSEQACSAGSAGGAPAGAATPEPTPPGALTDGTAKGAAKVVTAVKQELTDEAADGADDQPEEEGKPKKVKTSYDLALASFRKTKANY